MRVLLFFRYFICILAVIALGLVAENHWHSPSMWGPAAAICFWIGWSYRGAEERDRAKSQKNHYDD